MKYTLVNKGQVTLKEVDEKVIGTVDETKKVTIVESMTPIDSEDPHYSLINIYNVYDYIGDYIAVHQKEYNDGDGEMEFEMVVQTTRRGARKETTEEG